MFLKLLENLYPCKNQCVFMITIDSKEAKTHIVVKLTNQINFSFFLHIHYNHFSQSEIKTF